MYITVFSATAGPEPPAMPEVTLAISVDTEEDDWGSYSEDGASTRNIAHLPEVQALFERHNARPTYLVTRPPLLHGESLAVLRDLAARSDVEMGIQCHPWNTPPLLKEASTTSMMCGLPLETNRAKIRELGGLFRRELRVPPRVFRTGRWALGPTVAGALKDEGYAVDCSVSPHIDWSSSGGPDYSEAPTEPYRFHPADPLRPDAEGTMIQLPTTIGFLSGNQHRGGRVRRRLERGPLARLGAVGVLDRLGFLNRRWLSPEISTGPEMIRLTETLVAAGHRFLQMTFHSCTLLPGATPFVRTQRDRSAFVERLGAFLDYSVRAGFTFRTLSEAAEDFSATESSGTPT